MCTRRVFANNNNLTFTDYNCAIKGQQIYLNLRSKGCNVDDRTYKVKHNEIVNFLDYDTFINITRTYFRHYGPANCSFNAPASINEAKESFLCYKQLLSHIKDCDYCCKCKNITQICDCKDVKNILYPYGNYFNKPYTLNDFSDKDFKFPIKLQFNQCSECHTAGCHGECRKLVPICNEASYDCGPNSCCEPPKPIRGCIDKCAKRCMGKTCCNPCARGNCCGGCKVDICHKPPPCLNNVYPSQHQFMYYKSGCDPCGSNKNYDEEKRINAYSVYPQINKNCFRNNIKSDCGDRRVVNTIDAIDYRIDYRPEAIHEYGKGIYPQINRYACYNNERCLPITNNCNPCGFVKKKCNPCCDTSPCGLNCDVCANAKPLFARRPY